MISFDSDYLEGCLPEILNRITETNLEQTPGYGEDRYCLEAAEKIRTAIKMPTAAIHFLVGGTQTNSTVISAILKPWQGVICATSGHINVHETGAIEHGGHKVIALPCTQGKISASQIEECILSHREDPSHEHCVQPGMVYLSFPTEIGTIYTLSELKAISDVCRRLRVPLFIDGARLGYGLCSEGCDINLPTLASLVDIFYIGGTKQGALFGEAVVFTDPAFCPEFRYNIKQNGGMLAKGRLLGLQFSTLFGDNLYYKASEHAVELALNIRDAFSKKGFSFLSESGSNLQFPILSDSQAEDLRRDFSFENWERTDSGHIAVRFCTSWATREKDVQSLISAIEAL
ncbi:MAG: low specificity L-threonine aldolase [Bacteroidales bacterium]|nr:low specificity L-threonine aldolase [Bacteroidales bacterium]